MITGYDNALKIINEQRKELAELRVELEAKKNGLCDSCGGDATPNCSCGGDGTAESQRDYIRTKLFELQEQNRKLREQLATLRAGIKHYHDGKITLSQLMDFY
jgi:cell division septum initiation protein DivIVA